jgi:hypothetical protein
MDVAQVITLIAVALGWLLNEVSSLLRVRREDLRAAGPVLRDLLEIRHQLVALDAVINELRKQFPLPPQARLHVQQAIQAFVPSAPRLGERYEEAVSVVARADPILAFRLGGQLLIGPMLAQLRGLAASDPAASEFWDAIGQPKLLGAFKPHLEELILDVARAHGWKTWWRARCRLRSDLLSQTDKDWISEFLAKLKEAAEKGRRG